MSIRFQQAQVVQLAEILRALGSWQHDGAPVQLHPGDLGWHWRFGAQAVAGALRVWRRDGDILAIGFLDGVGLIRMGIGPASGDDAELATRVVDDLSDPAVPVLPAGEAVIEARAGAALRAELDARGWVADEPWIPLHRDLTDAVDGMTTGLQVEVVEADGVVGIDGFDAFARAGRAGRARDWLEVVRLAFGSSPPPPDRWPNLGGSPMLQEGLGRCLIGYEEQHRAVAAVTVWSAGPGRPGLVEPMGVHAEHRGRGYGRGITVAAAAALRSMGSSSVVVATPAARLAAVATYAAAGFRVGAAVTDFRRPDRPRPG